MKTTPGNFGVQALKNYGILTLEMTMTKKDKNVFKRYTMEQK
jgi:hypothetical protein